MSNLLKNSAHVFFKAAGKGEEKELGIKNGPISSTCIWQKLVRRFVLLKIAANSFKKIILNGWPWGLILKGYYSE